MALQVLVRAFVRIFVNFIGFCMKIGASVSQFALASMFSSSRTEVTPLARRSCLKAHGGKFNPCLPISNNLAETGAWSDKKWLVPRRLQAEPIKDKLSIESEL